MGLEKIKKNSVTKEGVMNHFRGEEDRFIYAMKGQITTLRNMIGPEQPMKSMGAAYEVLTIKIPEAKQMFDSMITSFKLCPEYESEKQCPVEFTESYLTQAEGQYNEIAGARAVCELREWVEENKAEYEKLLSDRADVARRHLKLDVTSEDFIKSFDSFKPRLEQLRTLYHDNVKKTCIEEFDVKIPPSLFQEWYAKSTEEKESCNARYAAPKRTVKAETAEPQCHEPVVNPGEVELAPVILNSAPLPERQPHDEIERIVWDAQEKLGSSPESKQTILHTMHQTIAALGYYSDHGGKHDFFINVPVIATKGGGTLRKFKEGQTGTWYKVAISKKGELKAWIKFDNGANIETNLSTRYDERRFRVRTQNEIQACKLYKELAEWTVVKQNEVAEFHAFVELLEAARKEVHDGKRKALVATLNRNMKQSRDATWFGWIKNLPLDLTYNIEHPKDNGISREWAEARMNQRTFRKQCQDDYNTQKAAITKIDPYMCAVPSMKSATEVFKPLPSRLKRRRLVNRLSRCQSADHAGA